MRKVKVNIKKIVKYNNYNNRLILNKKVLLIFLSFVLFILLSIYLHNYYTKQNSVKEEFFGKIKKGFKKGFKEVKKVGKKAGKAIKDTGEKAGKAIKDTGEKAFNETKDALEVFNIKEAIKDFKNGIKSAITIFKQIDDAFYDVKDATNLYVKSIKNIPKTFDKLN